MNYVWPYLSEYPFKLFFNYMPIVWDAKPSLGCPQYIIIFQEGISVIFFLESPPAKNTSWPLLVAVIADFSILQSGNPSCDKWRILNEITLMDYNLLIKITLHLAT